MVSVLMITMVTMAVGGNVAAAFTLVGTLVTSGTQLTALTTVLGFIAVTFATVNVVGGFLVTHRMLAMFHEKDEPKPSGD